ncbi:MAG: NfeD-like C-terminal, partner-binding [Pseudomonadota bacterium]|jgi:membrane protein implicated in regulation of membrane protease activity
MANYQLYLVLSILLIVGELFAPGFILLPLGLAGLLTALVAYFRPELWLHAVFFICGSGFALLALSRFRDTQGKESSPGAGGEGLVGQVGTIVSHPEAGEPLRVKIYGDVWDVVEGTVNPSEIASIPVGSKVKVTGVSGNKITIERF